MKDRLVELRQVVSDSPSSTQWYDQPVKKLNGLTDESPLLTKADDIGRKIFKKRTTVKANVIISKAFRKEATAKKSSENVKCDKFLANLQTMVHRIKSEVSQIQSNTREITTLHTKALMVPSLAQQEKLRIEELEKNTRSANSRVVKLLKDLEQIEVPDTAAVKRIHSVQLFQANKSFLDAAEKYEAELIRYARALRQQVTKQCTIANGGRCDSAVVDACIEDGRLQMFVDNYLATEQEARVMLKDVEDRHTELVAVEKSILEVRDLFAAVTVLVMTQGETIDNIEAHVEAANAEVSKGSKNLSSAKKKQRSARKKKVILATVGTAVATGLIATLVLL